MRMTRQGVVAQLLGAAELARELGEPSSMVSALKSVAQICGYYRQEGDKPVGGGGNGLAHFERLSDADLLKIIAAGQVSAQ